MQQLIASVAGDAGGAEALAPVLALVARRGALGPVWAGPAAKVVFDRAGIEAIPVATSGPPAEALERASAGALLTGTSWGSAAIEAGWIEAGRIQGITTVSIVDFWSNYDARFGSDGGRRVYPDWIAVPDQTAVVEAIADGVPAERVVATGNPHYEALVDRYRTFDQDARLRFREAVGVSAKRTLVLFASQPIRALYGDDLGYTEESALAGVYEALEQVAEWIGHSIVLSVRAHPRQSAVQLPPSTPSVMVQAADRDDPVGWALAADLITGMNSALLLQAALLGGRVVSVQPGLRARDLLPSNRMGLSDGVYSVDEVAPALYRALARPAHFGTARAIGQIRTAGAGAAERVLALVCGGPVAGLAVSA